MFCKDRLKTFYRESLGKPFLRKESVKRFSERETKVRFVRSIHKRFVMRSYDFLFFSK